MTFAQLAERPLAAVVGGGRWARTITSVLSGLCDEKRTIVVCSPTHPEGWHQWLRTRHQEEQRRFIVGTSLEQITRNESIGSVFVVRAARDNAATAIKCLAAGKETFVEKPFALNRADAERVIAAAKKTRCAVGHVLLFSSSVRTFVAEAAKLRGLRRIEIEWYDASAEFRHGEAKSYDHSINVVQDAFPHLWCLIRLLVPDHELRLQDVAGSGGGRYVRLALTAADIQIAVAMQRDAPARRRVLRIVADDAEARIDFSTEPGLACIGDQIIDVDTGFVSPLAQELTYFLNPSSDPVAARFTNVENALETVTLSEVAVDYIRAQQGRIIQSAISEGSSAEQQESAVYALREWIAGDQRIREDTAGNYGRHDKQIARKILKWLTGAKPKPPFNELMVARWIDDWRLTLKE